MNIKATLDVREILELIKFALIHGNVKAALNLVEDCLAQLTEPLPTDRGLIPFLHDRAIIVEKPIREEKDCPPEILMGVPVVLDPTLPAGTAELRTESQRIRIEGEGSAT